MAGKNSRSTSTYLMWGAAIGLGVIFAAAVSNDSNPTDPGPHDVYVCNIDQSEIGQVKGGDYTVLVGDNCKPIVISSVR